MDEPACGNPPPPAPPADRPAGGKLWAWLQLLRVPNLFTVPGDPIAGYLLGLGALTPGSPLAWPHGFSFVGVHSLLMVALAGLLLYAGGLVLNDWFDLAEDRRDRPYRPLPSGAVRPRLALAVGLTLLAAGVAAAWAAPTMTLLQINYDERFWVVEIGLEWSVSRSGWTALILAGLILAYNGGLKRVRIIGPLAMGLCRGLSVMVGVTAILDRFTGPNAQFVWASAAGLTLYIAAVTQIARGETASRRVGGWRFAPLAALGALAVSLAALSKPFGHGIVEEFATFSLVESTPLAVTLACLGWAMFNASQSAAALKGAPEPKVVQRTIGKLILNLLVIQAMLIAFAHPWGWTISLALCAVVLPLARLAGRRFYGS